MIFPWVFLSTLLLRGWYRSWTLLYGVINLSLAITVAIGISMEAQFLPATSDGCKWGRSVDWQAVPGHPSFFTLVAALDRNDESESEAVCKGLVGGWTIAAIVA